MTLNHTEMCELARRWLLRAAGSKGPACQVAFREVRANSGGESPDAIGFRDGFDLNGSYLVEVKVSRADFLADAKKPYRQNPDFGMGKWRFYMCPEGLIEPTEIPPRWGLLWVGPRNKIIHKKSFLDVGLKLKHMVTAQMEFRPNYEAEARILTSLVKKFQDPQRTLDIIREQGRIIRNLQREKEQTRRTNEAWLRIAAEGKTP